MRLLYTSSMLAQTTMLALAARGRTPAAVRMASSTSSALPPLVDASGNDVVPDFTGKRVGLYFTAGWCVASNPRILTFLPFAPAEPTRH